MIFVIPNFESIISLTIFFFITQISNFPTKKNIIQVIFIISGNLCSNEVPTKLRKISHFYVLLLRGTHSVISYICKRCIFAIVTENIAKFFKNCHRKTYSVRKQNVKTV